MEINSAELKALEKAMKDAFDKMGDNLKRAQDVADKALDESKRLGGVIEGKTNDQIKTLDDARVKLQEDFLGVRNQVLELAQKMATKPAGGSGDEHKSVHQLVIESPQWQECSKRSGAMRMDPVVVGSWHKHLRKMLTKDGIVNATGLNQPLVPPERLLGIITPAEQRLYIRDLLPQEITASNLIEFTTETTYTPAAHPQGDVSTGAVLGEGELFAEAAMTFALNNSAVITIGHWIPASRQVLSDATLLQGHINERLMYGLKKEEETELLTGNGTAGSINGLNNQATAYNRGATGDTILDTLLKAILQVSLSNYEASGFVLHPVDWYSAMMLKDTLGRYLFSDPQSMVAPRVWAKPVVPSQTMTQGKFLCGAFSLGAQIWDREDANIRISENVQDHFIRNMVAILVEERLALTVFRPAAFIYGNTHV